MPVKTSLAGVQRDYRVTMVCGHRSSHPSKRILQEQTPVRYKAKLAKPRGSFETPTLRQFSQDVFYELNTDAAPGVDWLVNSHMKRAGLCCTGQASANLHDRAARAHFPQAPQR
jgi:hypothetical protein